MLIDLHCHSDVSADGDIPCESLVSLAGKQGISMLAVCDHNTLDHIARVERAANGSGLAVIKGCEVSAQSPFEADQEIHILAYGPPDAAWRAPLVRLIDDIQGVLQVRGRQLTEAIGLDWPRIRDWSRSNRADVPGLTSESIDAYAVSFYVKGLSGASKAETKRRLAEASATLSRQPSWPRLPEPGRIVRDLSAAGALTSLAHPMRYGISEEALDRLVRALTDDGLNALEAHYAPDPDASRRLAAKAEALGLATTAGSDLHRAATLGSWRSSLRALGAGADARQQTAATATFLSRLTGAPR